MTQASTPLVLNQTVHRHVLPNGIVLLVIENPTADIIAGRLFFRTGSLREQRHQAGLSHLLAATLTKGTDQLTSLEIAERVESVGARLSTDTTSDYFLVSLKTVSEDFTEILRLTAEMLRSPSFPESEIDLERRIAIQAIRSQQEQPFSIAFNALRQLLYQDHPYAISSLGTEETVAQLTQEDLQIYHQAHFRPDNMVVAIAGRISPEQALERIESAFGDWPMPETKLSQPELPEVISNPQQSIISQATQQSVILLGYLASSVYQDDYSALKLLSTYLGNGLSSRLFVELREKRGLAYDVSAFFPTRLDPSHFVTYIGTAPENTETATEGLHREVKRLVAAPLSDQELQVAKNKLLGQYALGKQTNGQLAQIYGWYETLGLGIEFDTQFQSEIAQVTPETAHSVARRYFDRDPYLSIIGPDLSHADPTC